ncbi:MAG: MFS transporter [Rhodocyclaceae bacterium]|nr:MFS transporter [Rhodocyclaceae bacterium]MBL0075562.1 MFS transporter [Rhodocyclaceae bacterium]
MAIHATAEISGDTWQRVTRPYAWAVFALTFGLLLSDYMSRQVLNVVFPLLKAEWGLSDTALGSLSSVVSIAVGLLAFPLSLVADRWGRIRSLTIMAAIWSVATLVCGLASGYQSMFAARFFVGVGEAAYASVGLAVVLSIFPPQQRSTVTGAFFAGSMLGSVMGIGLGGVLATHFGWRTSFVGMAVYGMALTVLYALVVKPARIDSPDISENSQLAKVRPPLSSLFSTPSVISIYVGSGLQLFITGALLAWLPSFLNRYYDMDLPTAGGVAAIFVLSAAAGMPICGAIADRLCHDSPTRKMALAVSYCLICAALLCIGFSLPLGTSQLVVIGMAMFFGTGIMGPVGTMVANLTPPPIHSTAMATWALSNNLIGLAPGPFITGLLADRIGLASALQLLPLAGVAAALMFMVGVRNYHKDLAQVQQQLAANTTSA